MPHRRQYRLPSSGRRRSGGFFVFAALLVLAGFGWLWWQSRQLATTDPLSLPDAQEIVSKPPPPAPAPATPPLMVVSPPTRTTPAPAPPALSNAGGGEFPREPRDVLEMQIALARHAFSSGSLDGVMGAQTRAALRAFQRQRRLPETGELDAATRAVLLIESPPLIERVISPQDVARLQPVSPTWLGKSQQSALEYESLIELVAEQSQAAPNLLRRLNPGVNWTNLTAGVLVRVPAIVYPEPTVKAAFIHIKLAGKQLQAFDANTNLLAHFPCSIAARVEKRPVGELRVTAIAPNPNYTFDPALFPDSPEAQQLKTKLILPPGPNNPVGTAWISLSLPGYGIHGTPSPEQVGRTESHSCFRLANWNAEYLLKLVWVGLPVWVEL